MGVISEPPPTPVRPTRKPTNRPENAYRGSMWGSAMERTVVGRMGLQTALDADASHDERGISGASWRGKAAIVAKLTRQRVLSVHGGRHGADLQRGIPAHKESMRNEPQRGRSGMAANDGLAHSKAVRPTLTSRFRRLRSHAWKGENLLTQRRMPLTAGQRG